MTPYDFRWGFPDLGHYLYRMFTVDDLEEWESEYEAALLACKMACLGWNLAVAGWAGMLLERVGKGVLNALPP